MTPFVSVIVPVYNGEAMIDECLRCINRLKYPKERLEVIVIDDGSTDKTVEKVKDHDVKLVQKEHSGYPSAMNAGVKAAKGEIILNIDSDTYIREDWLLKALEEFEDPKVGMVSGYVATKPNAGFWARVVGFGSEDRYDRMKSKYVDFITSTCTAYRRELFAEIGVFNEALKRGNDEDFAHRALKVGWKIVLRKDAICYHEWVSSVRKVFIRQVREMIYQVENFRKHPELLLGKTVHPLSLYIPFTLMFLLVLTPLWLLINAVWVSILSFVGLVLYHTPRAVRIIRKHRDWTMLLLPIVINVRYIAWLVGLPIGIARLALHR